MSDVSTSLERLKRIAARVRPQHVALVAAAAVVGVGFMTVRAVALPGPRPVLDGDRLHIQVVAPVEPEIAPGSVMDVGDLVDGFEYTPPPRAEPEPAVYAHDGDEEVRETRTVRSDPPRYADEAAIRPPPPPLPPRGDGWRDSRAGRWFGFDAPDRDYRAEREARHARREAQMRYEREDPRPLYDDERPPAGPGPEGRSVRWYSSDGRQVDDRRDPRRYRDDRPPPDRRY